jgi:hypothetical protein
MNMDTLAIGAFVFLTGLTASGLAGTAIEMIAGARLSLGEPFVSERNISRSLVLVLLAGPYMVINDATLAAREKRVGAVGLIGIVMVCGVWVCAAGVLILGAVSEFSALSAAAARICAVR